MSTIPIAIAPTKGTGTNTRPTRPGEAEPPPDDDLETTLLTVEEAVVDELEDVVRGILIRFRLEYFLLRFPRRIVLATFSLINGFLSIAVMAAAALATDEPFVFPSLGPTAFLLFYRPTTTAASPRNTILGHAIGAAAGYGCLVVFGLAHEGPTTAVGMTWPRVLAAALSLALTSFLMVLLNVSHPPAAATTLIISLGVITRPIHIVVLMLAVVLLVLQAILTNKLSGIAYPLWSTPQRSTRCMPAK
jgi:CBS-domain-containing membrane protein